MHRLATAFLLFIASSTFLFSQNTASSVIRMWTHSKGHSYRPVSSFRKSTENIPGDAYLKYYRLHKKGEFTQDEEAFSKFKPLDFADRDQIPLIDTKEYGARYHGSAHSALLPFLIWWDQYDLLKLPISKDFDRTIKWTIKHLESANKGLQNKIGLKTENSMDSFIRFFDTETANDGTIAFIVDYDCSPQNIARYTFGNHAVLIKLSYFINEEYSYSAFAPVISCSKQGDIVLYSKNAKIRGKLQKIPDTGTGRVNVYNDFLDGGRAKVTNEQYKILISNTPELSSYFNREDLSIRVKPADCLIVINPYKYKTPGSKIGAPFETNFPPQVITDIAPTNEVKKTRAFSKFSYENIEAITRTWTRKDGKKLKAKMLKRDGNTLTLNGPKKAFDIDLNTLSPNDQFAVYLLDGFSEHIPEINQGSFTYEITRPDKRIDRFTIEILNEHFRISSPQTLYSLVGNAKSAATAIIPKKSNESIKGKLCELFNKKPKESQIKERKATFSKNCNEFIYDSSLPFPNRQIPTVDFQEKFSLRGTPINLHYSHARCDTLLFAQLMCLNANQIPFLLSSLGTRRDFYTPSYYTKSSFKWHFTLMKSLDIFPIQISYDCRASKEGKNLKGKSKLRLISGSLEKPDFDILDIPAKLDSLTEKFGPLKN